MAQGFRYVLVLCLGSVLLAGGCKIVRDGSPKTAMQDTGDFNADAYVTGIWQSKVMPLAQDKATEIAVVLEAIAKDPASAAKKYGQLGSNGSASTYLVKGHGKVQKVDVASRHGTLVIDIISADGTPHPVTLQIGPVVFGTTLRDSIPFISFNDFSNQIDYAQVARNMNDRAMAGIKSSIDPATITDKDIKFVGSMADPGSGDVQVTPLLLQSVMVTP